MGSSCVQARVSCDALGGAFLDGFLDGKRLGFEQTLIGRSSTCQVGVSSISPHVCAIFTKSVTETYSTSTNLFDKVLHDKILRNFYGMFSYELYALGKIFRSKFFETKSVKISHRVVLCSTVMLNLYFDLRFLVC